MALTSIQESLVCPTYSTLDRGAAEAGKPSVLVMVIV
jgi:hypothetical protein